MDTQTLLKKTSETFWNILMIDDDEDDYLIVREMLGEAKGRKVQLHWASTYAAGQRELLSADYDAVLVDYDIGARTGIDLIREANERGFASPLILFTGRGNYEVDVEAMQAGATLYITKNEVNPLLLERIIRYAIDIKQKEHAERRTSEALRASNEAERRISEALRRSSELLRRSEEKFSRSFRSSPVALAISTVAEGRFIEVNDRYLELFGFSREELIGHTSIELGMFPDPARRQQIVQLFRASGGFRDEALELLTKSGQRKDVIFSTETIEVDEQACMLSLVIDITERKQADQTLKESQARFTAFVEGTHDSFIALDRDWRFTYANRHYGEVMGRDPQALIGQNYWALFPQYVGTELERHYRQTMAERTPSHFRLGGVYTKSQYEVSVYPTDEGIAVFSIDRTEALRYQQQLEDERARLETMLHTLPVGVWIADASGEIISINEQADRIWAGNVPLAKGVEQYGTYEAWEAESGRRLEIDDYPMAVTLRTGQPVERSELRIRRFDGSEGYLLVSSAPVMDSQGKLMGVVAINVDISEHKQAEAALKANAEALKANAAVLEANTAELEANADALRQAAEALRQSEARLSDVLESTHDMVFLLDRDWRFQYVNKRYQEYHQAFAQEFVGRLLWDIFPRYRGSILEQRYRKVMEARIPDHFDLESAYLDGVVYEMSVYPTQDGIAVFSQDRTEEKQARDALRDSNQALQAVAEEQRALAQALEVERAKLAAAIDTLPVGVCIADPQGNVLSLNSAGLRLHGFTSEAEMFRRAETYLQGFELLALDGAPLPPDAWPFTRALRGDFMRDFEVILRSRLTGLERVVAYSAVPARDSAGQTLLIVYQLEDRTEQKQAEAALRQNEAALRQSEANLRHMANAMPQLVWMARPDGTVDYYNERVQEYEGIRPTGEATWEWAPVLHPEDSEATLRAWNQALLTGEMYQIEHRVHMRDGAYRWHLSRGLPLKDADGKIQRWYGTATDIEDQKQNEEKLKRSNEELEQFAFVASHDLQEPLRKIVLFGKSLKSASGATLDPTALDYLERMENAASRMQDMVNGLLELSRINRRGGEFTPVDLNQLAEDVLSDLETRLQAVGGQVIIDHPLPGVEGDALQLRQLLQNLISNALKFHQPDVPPVVRVSGRLVNHHKAPVVEIRVVDNGIGFEQQYAERIFQPFQRLHGRSAYEGTGLGLAICQKIVERHQGTITVKSAPGEGSTFIIRLPGERG